MTIDIHPFRRYICASFKLTAPFKDIFHHNQKVYIFLKELFAYKYNYK